ncbi:hypothetical protein ACFLU6_16520 [Acidobacteriota bacterium]
MKKVILVLVMATLSVSLLQADILIKTNTHTAAFEMMGQSSPAKDEETMFWIAKSKFATITPELHMMADLEKKVAYFIYPKSKTYVETQLPLDMSQLLPEQMVQMMSAIKIAAEVKPSGETKKIGEWDCKGYDVLLSVTGMMPMKMNIKAWASTDVPFDWETYTNEMLPVFMKAATANMPFGDEIISEFQKIKGFQIASETTTNIMGVDMKVSTKVLEITKVKSAPKGTFDVPEGFTKQKKLMMERPH